jgi:hypothetical protein
MYTIATIFSTALQVFGGASQASFRSPNQTISQAVLEVTNNVTLVESRRVVPLLPAIYGGEYLYPIGNDVDKIIDIIPMVGRSVDNLSNFRNTTSGIIKNDILGTKKLFNIEYRNGVRVLRLDNGLTADMPMVLFNGDSLTESGTVAVSGDANNLSLNTIMQMSGVGAIDFNITPNTNQAVFQVTGIEPRDLSPITKDGSFTLGIFVPQELVGHITSISLAVGDDTFTNTLTMSSNQNMYGGAFIHGWNFVQFKYRSGIEAGTFDNTAVTAIKGTINHDSTNPVTGVLIDSINAHKGLGYNLEYYSRFHFINSAGALIEKAESQGLDDKVITSQEGFNLIVHEARKLMDFELKGGGGGEIYQLSELALNGTAADKYNKTRQRGGAYDEYRQRHPSELKPLITPYN